MSTAQPRAKTTLVGILRVLGVCVGVAVLQPSVPGVSAAAANIFFVVGPLLVAVVCWRAASRRPSEAPTWKLLALGVAIWSFASVGWAVDAYLVPAWISFDPNWFYVAYGGPVLIAVVRLAARGPRGGQGLRRGMNGLVCALAAALAYWVLFVSDAIRAAQQGRHTLIALWLVINGVLVAAAFLHALQADRAERAAGIRLVLAFTVIAVTDGIYHATPDYAAGGVLDLGWVIGFLLLASAARAVRGPSRGDAHDEASAVADVAVYALSGGAALTWFVVGGGYLPSPVPTLLLVALVMALLGRQIVMTRQYVKLLNDSSRQAAQEAALAQLARMTAELGDDLDDEALLRTALAAACETVAAALADSTAVVRDGRSQAVLATARPAGVVVPDGVAGAKLQRMDSIGQLAGGVARDINNMLAVMLGNVELLEERADAGQSTVEITQLRRALMQGKGLVEQLLTFSRRKPVATSTAVVSDAVASAEPLLATMVGRQVEIHTHIRDPGSAVRLDAVQIQQILLNLAGNARDAMPDGGRLDILTDASAHRVRLLVRDTGTGMAPETVHHALEPFFTTKAPGLGTGLGLPVVYGLVTHAGGSVRVESAEGAGTTVIVELPRVERREDPAAAIAAPARDAGRSGVGAGRVLLVEDQPEIRQLVTKALTRAGYVVCSAVDGVAALEVAGESAEDFDVIVTDVVMPRLTGPEFVKRLTGAVTPAIVYMSGYAAPDELPTCGPGVTFVQKPFTFADLRAAMEQARAGLPARAPAA